MKACCGVDVQLHEFLTLGLNECEWSASRPDRFTPRKEALEPIEQEDG
jgi:hypothetical protein